MRKLYQYPHYVCLFFLSFLLVILISQFVLVGTNLHHLEKEICRVVQTLPKERVKPNADHTLLMNALNSKSLPRYKGLGTVLNIWTNPTEGQMIHVVVTDGELSPGLFFSSGGWAG